MKALILATTLATTALAVSSEPPPIPPLSAVVITQCNNLVVVITTSIDGTLRHYGPGDGLTSDQALFVAKSAGSSIQVAVKCPGERSI